MVQHSTAPSANGVAGEATGGAGAGGGDELTLRHRRRATDCRDPRQVIKTAQVALRVPHGEDRARHHPGHSRGREPARVRALDRGGPCVGVRGLVMRVPAARFENALAALARLPGVTVSAQTVSGQEVGQQLIDLNARAANLESQEVVLRRLMNEAQTVSDTIAVENQLASVQGQLDQIHGRLRYLTDQTSLSTITCRERDRATPPGKPSTIGAAFRRGENAAAAVVAATIVAVGFLLPLAFLVLLVLVIAWRLWPLAGRIANRSGQRPLLSDQRSRAERPPSTELRRRTASFGPATQPDLDAMIVSCPTSLPSA